MPEFEIPRLFNVIKEAGKSGRKQGGCKLIEKDGRITVSTESMVMRTLVRGLSDINKNIPVHPYWDIKDISKKAFIVTPIDEPHNLVYNEPWHVSIVYVVNSLVVYAVIYSVIDDTLYYSSVGRFNQKFKNSTVRLTIPRKQETFCLCVDEPIIDIGYKLIQGLPGASQASKLYVGKSFNEATLKFLDGVCGMMVYRSPVRDKCKYLAAQTILRELNIPYRIINGMVCYSNVKEVSQEDAETGDGFES